MPSPASCAAKARFAPGPSTHQSHGCTTPIHRRPGAEQVPETRMYTKVAVSGDGFISKRATDAVRSTPDMEVLEVVDVATRRRVRALVGLGLAPAGVS